MKTYTIIKEETKPKLVIEYDEDPLSPRKDSHDGIMVLEDGHNIDDRFHGDNQKEALELFDIMHDTKNVNSCNEHIKVMNEMTNDKYDIYTISKYEHGNIIYSLGESHGFDSGVAGFYFIDKKKARNNQEETIKNELDVFNKYINGEVLCFTLFDDNGEIVDICSGFYDIEDIREYLPKEWKNEDLADYLI